MRKAAMMWSGAAAVLQAVLLGAALWVQELTTQKMMVMRYFVAKNLLLEGHIFSPLARALQAGVLAIVAATAMVVAVRWSLRHRRADAARAGVAGVLAAAGAAMLLLMSAEQTRGLYVLVFAVWLALIAQLAVVLVSARAAQRSAL